MTPSKRIIASLIFSAGLVVGLGIQQLVPEAQADTVDWRDVAQEPEFRDAVIEVINGCIVDNGIIFCN